MFTDLTDSVYTLNWGGWVLETANWVPGVRDKVGPCPFLILDETLVRTTIVFEG